MNRQDTIRTLGLLILLWLLGMSGIHAQNKESSPSHSVIGIQASVPEGARTAGFLGTKRAGSGIVINKKGLVVTIGYLILEAKGVQIIDTDGKSVPATVVGYDAKTGFGLIRANTPLQALPLPLGQSSRLSKKDPVIVINESGKHSKVFVGTRQTFTGSWEYLLENAIFTVPAVTEFSGAALIDRSGALVGVGSLFLRDFALEKRFSMPANMFLPIDALKGIIDDLVEHGRPSESSRPWLGINVVSQFGRVMVQRVTPSSPANFARLAEGDIILEVNGHPVDDLEPLFRAIWKSGEAGATVLLKVLQQHRIRKIKVISDDRYQHYKL